ncbi:MAG: hypothetical protein JJT96_09060 [Opitutales bacterium]|nr:hypothetical protein [Opitutales bacterium]
MHRSRHFLSEDDLAFIQETLAKTPADRDALLELLIDPDEADKLLDHPALFNACDRPRLTGNLSLRLFFYIRLRKVFSTLGVDDRDLADYVACQLAEAAHRDRWLFPFSQTREPMLYAIEYFRDVETASGSQAFFLHASAGNHYLFMTGLFAPFLEKRKARRGAPGPAFYESLGARSYAKARDHRLAREYGMVELFDHLSSSFPHLRAALATEANLWRKAS